MKEENVEEKVEEVKYATNWEERIEYKLNMLFEELLDFREQFNYICSQEFIKNLKREKESLEQQLADKTSRIQNIDNNQSNSYRERYDKLNRFRGVK